MCYNLTIPIFLLFLVQHVAGYQTFVQTLREFSLLLAILLVPVNETRR